MLLDRKKCACFSGYRAEKMPFPLYEGAPLYDKLVADMKKLIQRAIKAGAETFYNGGAYGFDIVAGETILDLKKEYPHIKLITVRPFIGQGEDYTPDWQDRYQKVIVGSDEVIVLSHQYYSGCYYARNRYMVDHSALLFCYFDGQPGGTKYTVNYAKRCGMRIVNLAEEALLAEF